ncbi:AI-2E family transporter [Aurantimonas sp. VKM B-3413]|uniref:AI-2E family transporter n=1 Tax=Aurantimonas sp. VKM B-3413 TaxID=2779401 RepID=UPI001E306074|nr:AI-2E family transporter [Aurantimonas sp. VKM B-3413]MCB8839895.1 AI-2E family transporter [Aurantimonas sp. VKM B-3413]
MKAAFERQTLSSLILIGAVLIGLYLCWLMAAPFLPAIVWSFVLAVLARPLNIRLRRLTGQRAISSGLTVALVAALVVFPGLMLAGTLLSEAVRNATYLEALLAANPWSAILDSHPLVATAVDWIDQRFDMQSILQSAAAWFGRWSAGLLQGSIMGSINLLLTFYFLFYLLRDEERAVAALEDALPLSREEFALLCERVVATIRASIFGTAFVAMLQGVLGGLSFWWLGLPAPIFWGVVMGILGIVPFLGAFVIWAPAAAYLALAGDLQSAGLLAVWGTFIVGLVDNLVYPILVGRQLMIHSAVSFVAVVGGIVVFGTIGFVLGPIVVAVSLVLVRMWRLRSLAAPIGSAEVSGEESNDSRAAPDA